MIYVAKNTKKLINIPIGCLKSIASSSYRIYGLTKFCFNISYHNWVKHLFQIHPEKNSTYYKLSFLFYKIFYKLSRIAFLKITLLR
jgi:hypothetical protein